MSRPPSSCIGNRFLQTVYSTYRLVVTSGDDAYRCKLEHQDEMDTMADPLTTVQRARARRAESEASWRASIRQARAEGASLRQIAAAAGVSHVRILQIVRQR